MKKNFLILLLAGLMASATAMADVYTDGLKKMIQAGNLEQVDTKVWSELLRKGGISEEQYPMEELVNDIAGLLAPYYSKYFSEEQMQQYVDFYTQPQMQELKKKENTLVNKFSDNLQTKLMEAIKSHAAGKEPKDVIVIEQDPEYTKAFNQYWDAMNMDETVNTVGDILRTNLDNAASRYPKAELQSEKLVSYLTRNYRAIYQNTCAEVYSQTDMEELSSVATQPFAEVMEQTNKYFAENRDKFLVNMNVFLANKQKELKAKKADEIVEVIEQPKAADDDVVFVVVETMPHFPGGQAALFQYLSENVHYPIDAQKKGIQGRAICQFTINEDGSVCDVRIIRSAGDASLDREARRVINSMPNWEPGTKHGKPVRVKYTVPVNFKL